MKKQTARKTTWKKHTRKKVAAGLFARLTFSNTEATMGCGRQAHSIHRTSEDDRTWGERIAAHWAGFVDNNRRLIAERGEQLAFGF